MRTFLVVMTVISAYSSVGLAILAAILWIIEYETARCLIALGVALGTFLVSMVLLRISVSLAWIRFERKLPWRRNKSRVIRL